MPDLSLRFRHHLLRDHQHVGWFELSPRADELTEVVAGMDLRKALDRKKLDAIPTARRTRARSAGSSRSRAIAGEMWIPNRTPKLFASRRKAASESAPKCSPIARGGWRYSALVPPRPVAGTATATGGASLPASRSRSRTDFFGTRGRSLERSSTASAPISVAPATPP